MMNKLLKIDRFIETVQVLFCALMFVLILILGSIQVFGRSIFSAAPPWTEEAMRFCGIYLTLIGSAITVRVDGHVSVDILIEHMKTYKAKAVLYIFSRLLCVIFLILFFPGSMALVEKSTRSLGAAIRIPYSYIYAVVPVGIVMMLCSYASSIPRFARQYLKGER
jgi:TRAP-type C4-dicarboxylate transport system permease small subunit